jgi:hypothetical protein
MKLHRLLLSAACLVAIVSLAGCGQKAAQNTSGTATSDSMLASSPMEQPQGQLQPQSQGTPTGSTQQQAPASQSQGSAPAPVHHASSSSGASHARHEAAAAPSATVAAGTDLGVTVGTALNSESATEGSAWSGTLKAPLIVGSMVAFPAGATVEGTVAAVKPAAKGDRAMLLLRVESINGKSIHATCDSMIAGSTRKRNVGAIAGGAAAGALIGKAMGGSGKSALIGGILGGAAASGAVAASKGFQVEVPAGKEIVFHVDHDTKVVI